MTGATAPPRLRGRTLIDALHAARVRVVVSVPDLCTSEGLLRPISSEPGLRLVRVCKEDEGVSICAALSYAGIRAVLLLQQTGLLDSINALRAIAIDYRHPVCLLVGLLGNAPGEDPRESARYGVRIVPPVLDAMGIPLRVVRDDAQVPGVVEAIDAAYARSGPVAVLLATDPT